MDGHPKYNAEIPMLYKCKKLTSLTVAKIGYVSEFVEAIKDYMAKSGDILDGDSVYEVIRNKFIWMLENDRSNRMARGVMIRMSKEVKGDGEAWKAGIPQELLERKAIEYEQRIALKKAARNNGAPTTREVSTSELNAEKLADMRLPDVDEDL